MSVRPPVISVLLPVHNADAYIADAVRSILIQTFRDFELLIFDDGSIDETVRILQSFTDERIQLFSFSSKEGYVKRLNQGIVKAKGKYIARMDADDVSLPNRLEIQYAYLEHQPEVGICGTWIQLFSDQGLGNICRYPETHEGCAALLLVDVCFAHPTVMMRKDMLTKHHLQYDETLLPVEDYGLWIDAVGHTKFANIPQVLYKYRQHPHQVSSQMTSRQQNITDVLRIKQLHKLLPLVTETDERTFLRLASGGAARDVKELQMMKQTAEHIGDNRDSASFGREALLHIIARSLFRSCSASGMILHKDAWNIWHHFRFRPAYLPTKKDYVTFALYCFLGYTIRRAVKACKFW